MRTSGTGGGSRDPEGYYDFERRDSENCDWYNSQFGAIFTWIFVWDKVKGESLCLVTVLLLNRGMEDG